jgi:hypothetical protein
VLGHDGAVAAAVVGLVAEQGGLAAAGDLDGLCECSWAAGSAMCASKISRICAV